MRHTSRLLAFMLAIILALPTMMFPSIAVGGSYNLNWAAADPAPDKGSYAPTYPKWEPSDAPLPLSGREHDPLPDAVMYGPAFTSSNFDAVESLMPKNLALGQIVPFELEIAVSGDTMPENGTITFEAYWRTKTTSGDDFGFDPDYKVIAAFVDTGDVGTVDPGSNAMVSSYVSTVVDTGSSKEAINSAITVTGLDSGDNIVVEIWVVLKKSISDKVSGNIQTGMIKAYTAAGDTISVGNQTVPLLQAGEFFTEDADLSILKTDNPDPVIVGDTLSYSVTVTNHSPDTVANGILVTDTLDANVTFVSASDGGSHSAGVVTWPLFSLAPGDSEVLTVEVTVNSDAPVTNFPGSDADGRGGPTSPASGSFDLLNKVEVSAYTDDPDPSDNIYYEPTNVLVQELPSLNITKTATETSFSRVGDVIHYTITVENTGNVTLTGVTVTDAKLGTLTGPAGDSGEVGKLDVGETWTYTGSYTATQADIDAGSVYNIAYADSDQTDQDSDDETVPSTQGPALNITKTAAEDDFDAVGDIIHYTITVENTGNVTLTGVTVSDPLLGTLTGPTGDGGQMGKLDVGETWTYTGTYTVKQSDIDFGRVDNTATADSNETGPDTDSESVPSSQGPALNITKTATEADFDAVGDIIHYTITVENVGNVTLTGVAVSDPLLGTLTGPISDTGQQGKLDVGETWTYTGSYTVTQADLDAGKVDNTATADSNETGPDTDSESVPADQNPSLNIMKDAVETSFDAVGDVIHYTITVENTGNITLTGITVSDPLLGTLTGPSGDADEDGKLDVDEIWSYTGSYTITLADLDRGYVLNTAYADSDQTETDQDDEDVPADINTALSIDKKTNGLDNAGRILVGRTVTWTYKVTNNSNITLTNIVVRDDKFSEPIGTIPSLAPGASATLSKTGTAALGDYTNEGTATFTPVEGAPIVARDTSSYTGYRERRDDPDYGDIRVFKFLDSDEDGKFDSDSIFESGMNGMTFSLYDEDKDFIESKTTGLNGTLTFTNLSFGTYYLKEMNSGFTITTDNFGADGFSSPIRVNSTTTVVVEVGNKRNTVTPEPIVEDIVEVIEEVPEVEVPLALPDTGEIPPYFAYGFGSFLMLAGAYLKRRSK